MIGRTVGNYVIQDRIGAGGMGAVYLAEHPRIGRRVAIKVLLPEFSKNSNVVARFFNEAKAANEIRHEHIIDIIDFGEMPEDGVSYIIMEYLDGHSLEATLERMQRMPLARAVHIARGIGRALGAAHAHGIVHRDLKPDNVFLVHRESDPDFVKVLDFGIAKLTQSATSAPELRTQTGALIGTPTYMAPEQCRGMAVDGRTDQYALGVILYRMLTGRLPFDAENLGELLLQHMTKEPAPLRQIEPTIPPGVEAAVLRALAKDPDARYARIEELLAALVDVATGPFPVLVPTAAAKQPVTAPTVAAPRPIVAPTLAAQVGPGAPPVAVAAARPALDTLAAAAGQKQNVTLPPARRSTTFVIAGVAALALIGGGAFVMMHRAGNPAAAAPNVPAAAQPPPAAPAALPPASSTAPSTNPVAAAPAPGAAAAAPGAAVPAPGAAAPGAVAPAPAPAATAPSPAAAAPTMGAATPPAATPSPAAPDKHHDKHAHGTTARPTALPRPPTAVEPAPAAAAPATRPAPTAPAPAAKPEPAKTAEPSTKAAAKPADKKPVYKGTKGSLITDFPAE